MTIVLGVLIAAAVLILAGIFITATLVICRRRTTSTSQLEQEDKQDRPNVYSEAPAPVSPATVFSIPSHVPRGFTSAGPRVRFRTDPIEMENRRSVYSPEDEEDIGVNSRIPRSNNGESIFINSVNTNNLFPLQCLIYLETKFEPHLSTLLWSLSKEIYLFITNKC